MRPRHAGLFPINDALSEKVHAPRELASGCARYPIQSNGNPGAEGSRDGITENARSYSRSVTLSRADHGRAWKLRYSLLEREAEESPIHLAPSGTKGRSSYGPQTRLQSFQRSNSVGSRSGFAEIRWHAFLRPWHTRSIIDRNNIGIVPFPSRGTGFRGNRVD